MDGNLTADVREVVRGYRGEVVQDAVLGYDGCRLTSVRDVSSPYWEDEVASFPDGDYKVEYDADGRLVGDGTRRIAAVEYLPFGNLPERIRFEDGSSVYSSYFSDGRLKERKVSTKVIETVTRVTSTGDTVRQEIASTVVSTRAYCGNFEWNQQRCVYHTDEGYYSIKDKAHYWYVRDRLGSTVAVVDRDGNLLQATGYYPSGTPYQIPDVSLATAVDAKTDRLHIGNRWIGFKGLDIYDNTARMHDPLLGRFHTVDPLWREYPSQSPWSHCAANPINFIDPSGKWSVQVHASPDRGSGPYAILSVFSNDDVMVFRTIVKVTGNGRIRDKENNDTPQGEYKILGWRETGKGTKYNTTSYGPNDLLALDYQGGEGGSRNGMHIHGGRSQGPDLTSTHGCIRMLDSDIAAMKEVTDKLTKENPSDVPTVVVVSDDIIIPVTLNNREDILLIGNYILEELIVNEKNENNN